MARINKKIGVSKKSAERIASRLRREGYRVRVIQTDKKPKLYESFKDGERIAKKHSIRKHRK